MNLTTHMMFGAVVGAIFFGRPEIILLVALGSAIPDLDREYGFLSEESFRRHQIHRALFHNFLFLSLMYLINPFLCLGAFLHTFLDALTTAKDRGVEWLYPFTRFVKRTLYDSNGNKLPVNRRSSVYLYRDEPRGMEQTSDPDLRPDPGPHPWRRTYGPAVSGRLLDEGIFLGSVGLFLLMVVSSATGVHTFIDLSYHQVPLSYTVPVLMGIGGGFTMFVTGEVFRRRALKEGKTYASNALYRIAWFASAAVLIAAVFVGAAMNPSLVSAAALTGPYYLAGAAVVVVVAFVVIRFLSKEHLHKGEKQEPLVV